MDIYTQFKIHEMKAKKFNEQEGICAFCNEKFTVGDKPELAHILKQGKYTTNIYGEEIIQHELNIKLTHSGYCNSGVQMNTNKTELVNAHVEMIREEIENG